MGQSQNLPHSEPVTFQQVEQAIKTIFDDQQTKFQPMNIAIPVQQILQNLSQNIPAQKTEEGFLLNHKMIQIFYHKAFLFAMGKLINLLIDKLEEIGQKTLVMVQRDEWQFCLNLANFIAFFTDDKLIRMMETVNIRSDLSESTQKYIQKLEKQGDEFAATQSLIDKLSFSEIERIEKCLRISMNQMIGMRTQVITRSQRTLKVIQKLQQACFILYLKALYSPQHTQSILNKAKQPEFLKSNLTIGHYFLGKGCDSQSSSIYESAVLFLSNLIQKNRSNLKEYKSLPTHLFKTLPIVNHCTIYDFVMNICLYSLSYLKDGSGNMYSRFVFNRLMTLKLLDLLIKEVRVTSQQITYYLEEICLQTRVGMIERSFVTDLVQHYVNVVNQTIVEGPVNKVNQSKSQSSIQPSVPVQPLIQKLSRQNKSSQILTKYLEGGKQNYNIKYSNKKYKITTEDIVTELQNDETIIQTEFRILCEKYIYEIVLGKKIMYQYNDRQIWSQILPNIIEDKGDSSGDEEDSEYKEKEQKEPNEAKNYKMQMKKEEESSSQDKIPKNKPISPQEIKTEPMKIKNSHPDQSPVDHLKHKQIENEAQEDENFEDISDHQNHQNNQQPIQTFQ